MNHDCKKSITSWQRRLYSLDFSPSKVRAALKGGRPEDAARLLGHWWTIDGHVAHGDARGKTLGFPTANLHLERNLLEPKYGVYAVRAYHGPNQYGGAANYGLRPMFAVPRPPRTLEAPLNGLTCSLLRHGRGASLAVLPPPGRPST